MLTTEKDVGVTIAQSPAAGVPRASVWGPCTKWLLIICVALMATANVGMFACVAFVAANFAPLVQDGRAQNFLSNADALLESLNSNTTKAVASGVSEAVLNIQLLPKSIPDVVDTFLSSDVGSVAAQVRAFAPGAMETIGAMQFSSAAEADVYLFLMQVIDLVHDISGFFTNWKPPSSASPGDGTGASGAQEHTVVERVLFGGGVMDWMRTQVDSSRLHGLGTSCAHVGTQLRATGLDRWHIQAYTKGGGSYTMTGDCSVCNGTKGWDSCTDESSSVSGSGPGPDYYSSDYDSDQSKLRCYQLPECWEDEMGSASYAEDTGDDGLCSTRRYTWTDSYGPYTVTANGEPSAVFGSDAKGWLDFLRVWDNVCTTFSSA